ncbi:TetR/AcrR family transcriptional regulator [Cryptosporangium phraense]|uniref:TetR/AcrR family transcriptional regulator n=1 Tax=Cryptosporangium phraense TaxID=2593070 RepID=A0A545AMQ6_9ACTN|nr:TetR/AcrR family transcriptional regulator [Cryptosporangium phraense]TQS42025.1 TetR/AcrR family transcriptional regulator [Cryptosporangium phraense]
MYRSETARAAPPGSSVHTAIVDAAVTCIRQHGIERASISAIALRAGVSRPTVYAYFETRDALVGAAMERTAADVAGRVVASARRRARTAAEFAVEALVVARREFRKEPAFYPISHARTDPWAVDQQLTEEALAMTRAILAPIVDYDPRLEPHLDEITETLVRWLLSLLMYDTPRTSTEPKLRAYLRRVVVLPQIGHE